MNKLVRQSIQSSQALHMPLPFDLDSISFTPLIIPWNLDLIFPKLTYCDVTFRYLHFMGADTLETSSLRAFAAVRCD